jgi:transposase
MSGYDEDKQYAVVAEVRRKWTDGEKQAVLADAAETSVSAAARKAGVAASLVFRWRKERNGNEKKTTGKRGSAFVPVILPAPPAVASATEGRATDRGAIEIELAGGRRLRVSGPVDAATLKQVIAVLEGR